MVGGLTHTITLRCEAELERVHTEMVDWCSVPGNARAR